MKHRLVGGYRMKIARRRFYGRFSRGTLLIGAASLIPGVVRSAPLVLKAGSSAVQAASSIAIRSNEAFSAIERETDGALKIQLFTDDVLGSPESVLNQVRTGAIQFLFSSGTGISIKAHLALEGVGFMFKNYQQNFTVYDGALGRRLRAELDDTELAAVGRLWAGGPLVICNSVRPIHVPDDLRGLKIRGSNAKPVRELFSALGAIPASVSPGEVYMAAQTHLIDGFSSLLEVIENGKLYETQKYLALTDHYWANYFFLANRSAWQALPDKTKDIVTRNMDKAALLQRRDDEEKQSVLAKRLAQQGLTLNAVDTNVFRAALSQYYATQKAYFGPDLWAMIESVVGKLG